MRKTAFVVCQHGDEVTPLQVIKQEFGERLRALVAHPRAVEKGMRFLQTDLNRSFPGQADGTLEERIAINLTQKLSRYDRVIDFHTATCETPIFAITTYLDKEHIDLARETGVRKLVYMQKSIASGRALINHVPLGISLECGLEGRSETAQSIRRAIEFYLKNKKIDKPEIFMVFSVFPKESEGEELDSEIKSFKPVRKGQMVSRLGPNVRIADAEFYPILPREKNYKGILCLQARKIE